MKLKCEVCGWVYDPAAGAPASNIPPGTPWNKVPDSFVCPECGAGKSAFVPQE
jgi:rubredoxin